MPTDLAIEKRVFSEIVIALTAAILGSSSSSAMLPDVVNYMMTLETPCAKCLALKHSVKIGRNYLNRALFYMRISEMEKMRMINLPLHCETSVLIYIVLHQFRHDGHAYRICHQLRSKFYTVLVISFFKANLHCAPSI